MNVKISSIIFMGKPSLLVCDGECHLAWGNNGGRYRFNDAGASDFTMLAANGGGSAPVDPGTCEGGDSKPTDGKMNKWCCRECERSTMVPFGTKENGHQVDVSVPEFNEGRK